MKNSGRNVVVGVGSLILSSVLIGVLYLMFSDRTQEIEGSSTSKLKENEEVRNGDATPTVPPNPSAVVSDDGIAQSTNLNSLNSTSHTSKAKKEEDKISPSHSAEIKEDNKPNLSPKDVVPPENAALPENVVPPKNVALPKNVTSPKDLSPPKDDSKSASNLSHKVHVNDGSDPVVPEPEVTGLFGKFPAWDYLLHPNDHSIREKLESEFPHIFAKTTPHESVVNFFNEHYTVTVGNIAANTLKFLKHGCSPQKIRETFEEVKQAYRGLKQFGYEKGLGEPKFPDFLVNAPSWSITLLDDGFSLPTYDQIKELTSIARVFDFSSKYPQLAKNLKEFKDGISNLLLSCMYIKAFLENAGTAAPLEVIERTTRMLKDIFKKFGLDEPPKQSVGLSLNMAPQQIHRTLDAEFFITKDIRWGPQLVLDGTPRPIQNVNLICYGISTLQCLANFLPLWRLTAMKNVTLPSSEKAPITFGLNKALEELEKSASPSVDVTPYINIKRLGDSHEFMSNLLDAISKEGKSRAEDFSATLQLDPFAKLGVSNYCDQCQKYSFPCCTSSYVRTGLIIQRGYADDSSWSPPKIKVLDIEQGKYVTYHLYAFTFGGDGHCIAYVKRRNGKWHECNDSNVRQVADADVPIIGGFGKKNERKPQLAFYLRTE